MNPTVLMLFSSVMALVTSWLTNFIIFKYVADREKTFARYVVEDKQHKLYTSMMSLKKRSPRPIRGIYETYY